MKKQFFRRCRILIFAFTLFITLIISNIPSYALTVNEVPNPRQQNSGWVTDMVDMLSPQAETQLNQMISELEKENGTEIAVVTVPTTKPSSTPKAFTTELFNTWGIGKKGQNNGILFLVTKGDRRTEIETGYGIEGILPDAKVGSIIRTQVTPQFKKGNFEAGIIAGTKSLIKELGADAVKPQTAVNSQPPASKVNPQPPIAQINPPVENTNTNPLIYLLLILIGLPVWKFVGLPLAKYISSCFVHLTKDDLSPSGTTRRRFYFPRKAYCEQCSKPMQQVEAIEIESYLKQPQKVAQRLGSNKFKGWRCSDCALDNMHLLIYEFSGKASNCPTCDELTVTKIRTEVISQATEYSSGTRRTWKECQCCNYATTTDETIPKLSPPSSSSSSSSSDSGSSSSSDFGGGDSGGGGAGDSW
ncbi:TPM domain-containing protein [Calothrix sp. CCY 0018]|uniref:TPM domain-containing protein n=1 Tax=Calothrix sp. CCY 0018 TaxID=3103864 RepID=UPI0039C689C3